MTSNLYLSTSPLLSLFLRFLLFDFFCITLQNVNEYGKRAPADCILLFLLAVRARKLHHFNQSTQYNKLNTDLLFSPFTHSTQLDLVLNGLWVLDGRCHDRLLLYSEQAMRCFSQNNTVPTSYLRLWNQQRWLSGKRFVDRCSLGLWGAVSSPRPITLCRISNKPRDKAVRRRIGRCTN